MKKLQNIGKIGQSDENWVLLTSARGAESRRKILLILADGPKNCNQMAGKLEVNWWSVQKHLRFMIKGNLIKTIFFGKVTFYKLTLQGEDFLTHLNVGSKTFHVSGKSQNLPTRDRHDLLSKSN